MSLYDGLDIEEKEVAVSDPQAEIAGWSSGFKLLQSQLQAKKASLTQIKRHRTGATVAPVVDLRKQDDKPLYFNQRTGKIERASAMADVEGSPFISTGQASSLLGVNDEYDPLRPNEFEEFMKKRKEQRREEERQKEIEQREKRRRERHKEMGYSPASDSDDEDDRRRRRRDEARKAKGAAIAPPQSLLEEDTNKPSPKQEEEDIWADAPDDLFDDPPPKKPAAPGAGFGMSGSVASKIMAKMGYREGSGLGKNQQGMSIALQVEKTSKRGGKIIHEKDLHKHAALAPPTETPKEQGINQTNANLLRNPSKVVLLRNMVGPGEVDDELEPETAEECSKYGKVNKCVIFEIPNAVDEEAVRIFVEFEKMDAAIKAVIDLNGRYFGGKVVSASFYNLDKFRRLDLADEVI